MELKSYQKKVMENLSSYIQSINEDNNIIAAWKDYWEKQDIAVGFGGVPLYNNAIAGVPHICMKVPTGGGKTFMACSAMKRIFDKMPLDKPKVVIWLVPSDPILVQTIKNLSDVNHPYRQKMDTDFAGRVGVYTKEMLLNGQCFSPDTVKEMLTVCILSYGSLRIDSKKKDVRKVYQENGNLLKFAEYFKDNSVLLADTPDTALIQTLRHLSPVIIVDESHNAGSDLSIEMLNNLNPSFVLDLTATPRQNSNIISYVDARELKKENMVKLPVIVYNRTSRQSVIQDAIQLRCSLEQQAIEEENNGGPYIRPIVLFQAQPKTSEDSETFDKIQAFLVEMGIPKEQIAIKTSNINTLEKEDLLSKNCKIRYIITVNALKEGWDCPFAYILASLANKTSSVDVEQILGRILRQPYAKKNRISLLNTSYVLTCSNDFHSTLENIVKGLNEAGFSKKDFRIGNIQDDNLNSQDNTQVEQGSIFSNTTNTSTSDLEGAETENFEDINIEQIKVNLENKRNDTNETEVRTLIEDATQQAEQYNTTLESQPEDSLLGGEIGAMLNQITMQGHLQADLKNFKIPQFFLKGVPDLFGGEYTLLEPENLSEGFTLKGQDSQISFELATGEMYQVDVEEQGEAVPKYKIASKAESEYIKEYLAKFPPKEKIDICAKMLCSQINKNNRYSTSDVNEYVHRIVESMTEDEISAMETAIPTYATKIREKIEKLEDKHREKQFYEWLDCGKIVCKESYELPKVITPYITTNAIPKSLYTEEKDDLNGFENKLIDVIVGLDNVKWWHRIIDRKDFRINGCINHYPDFMVMTNSNKLILVESKGEHLDGSASKTKLKLGRKWQSQAGDSFRYFMVFEKKELDLDGSYTIDKFAEIIKAL